jgi:hypothetical protein
VFDDPEIFLAALQPGEAHPEVTLLRLMLGVAPVHPAAAGE